MTLRLLCGYQHRIITLCVFLFYRVNLISSDYRVYMYRHVLLFVLVYRDYGHTALYTNGIALQIYFYFSHILYNLDQ